MHVALTGATGFLGLRLLRRLLDTHAWVTVLAHAGSGDALHRITRSLELTGAPSAFLARLPERLRVVETDLALPRLGLSARAFRELADSLGAIWHSAGSIHLEGDLPELRRTNVEGTRHVLELAAAGRAEPVVRHVSTAFVAGARRTGVAYEDELDDGAGFENAYEQSKYEAELLVHAWSREHGRPALVLRPSILVTDVPSHPELPSHPLQVVERILRDARRATVAAPPTATSSPNGAPDGSSRGAHGLPGPGARPRVRTVGHPHGRLNLLPVEHAADVMVRLSELPSSHGVDTYHVVHDRDVPVPTVVALLERLVPLSIDLVDAKPEDPSALETMIDFYPGITAYLTHRRRFDDTRVRTLLGPAAVCAPVGLDGLWSGLAPRSGAFPRPPDTPPAPAPTPCA
ncbi:SDR family oxidoreductase [Streptomyces anthocyanicus]|uniref:SDR family oxidoreductase n=1 Tax=Streptomyces anthocyanicus TaxID=68174 RepID=UPI003873AE7A|nr:SDR family oxidoreductase [Streptomyces anthocyanicus]